MGNIQDVLKLRKHKWSFSSQDNEEDDTGKTIKDIEEEKKAEKEKQQK